MKKVQYYLQYSGLLYLILLFFFSSKNYFTLTALMSHTDKMVQWNLVDQLIINSKQISPILIKTRQIICSLDVKLVSTFASITRMQLLLVGLASISPLVQFQTRGPKLSTRGCLNFSVFSSRIILFLLLTYSKIQVPQSNILFGCVFKFRFHHSIFTKISNEFWKLKTSLRCFQILDF